MTSEKLQNHKERLFGLRAAVRERIDRSLEAIREETHPPGEHANSPSEGIDAEITCEQTDEDVMRSVEAALSRIEQGQFGTCEACGRNITDDRLDVIPYAAYCIDCERAREQPQSETRPPAVRRLDRE